MGQKCGGGRVLSTSSGKMGVEEGGNRGQSDITRLQYYQQPQPDPTCPSMLMLIDYIMKC